ncbi:hypothetical protein J1N35_035187 [Gossypium stocksii]|uniref:CCHC-type domain-containing protein n=1 Tax=Gossypium stocksii TaxID=47602 RepID=A0A9D3UTI6_9ROSI|nr:hypothetical protein J1N35_035187 [Gossypium stocksii]
MEEELANLCLLEDEEEAFQLDAVVFDQSLQFCLVGRALTESIVHFPSYMQIRVCLDVTASLKRKKKIQIGEASTVYARFKYEKLSLFCFICGKLGHGESYCPFRLRIEPSKIVYGSDLSLRAAPGRRNTVVSRWLREADGSQCSNTNMESVIQNNSFNGGIDFERIMGSNFGNQMLHPNLFPSDSNQWVLINEKNSSRIMGKSLVNADGLVNGPMEIILEEENHLMSAT